MGLFVVGINHKVASVEVRESASLPEDQLRAFYQAIKEREIAVGVIVISTCNRTEFYIDSLRISVEMFYEIWAEFTKIRPEIIARYCYRLDDDAAVYHLLEVAAGLDSLILGEPQIMRQLKNALEIAIEENSVSKVLHRLFQLVFYKAKRIRTETNIGAYAISVAYTAVQLAKQVFDIQSQRVLLLGAGETIALVAEHLISSGVKDIAIINRTRSRAEEMSTQLAIPAKIYAIDELSKILPTADVVIASTGAPHSFITKNMTISALGVRQNKPMLMIDIAVPRDIDQDVNEVDDVFLYNIDDLNGIVEKNYQSREAAAKEATVFLKEGVEEWKQWLQLSEISVYLQSMFEYVEDQKLITKRKANQLIHQGRKEDDLLDQILIQMGNRVLHPLVMLLKELEHEGEADLVKRIVERYTRPKPTK